MSMPAGKYYIGDLCYVLDKNNDWDNVCSLIIPKNDCVDGEFAIPDGRRFASYSTAFGDGTYEDNLGNSYGVDAGLIGCILMSDIFYNEEEASKFGAVVNFSSDFQTDSEEGLICIGHVCINTNNNIDNDMYDFDGFSN